jgi:RHS repeat-associated protein
MRKSRDRASWGFGSAASGAVGAIARAVSAALPRRSNIVRIRQQQVESLEQRKYMSFGSTASYPYALYNTAENSALSSSADIVVPSAPATNDGLSSGRPSSVSISVSPSSGGATVSIPAPWSSAIPTSGAQGFDPAAGLYWRNIAGFTQGRGAPIGYSIGFDLTHLPQIGVASDFITLFDGNAITTYDSNGSGTYNSRDGTSTIYSVTVGSTNYFMKLDSDGTKTFFSSTTGTFQSMTDPYGNVTTATMGSSGYEVAEIDRHSGSATGAVLESVVFTYNSSGFLTGASYRRPTTVGGTPVEYASIAYAYYGSGDSNGSTTDIQKATWYIGSSAVGTLYFRYYTGQSDSEPAHFLKSVFSGRAQVVLQAAYPSTWSTTASDSAVAPYADLQITYNSDGSVYQYVTDGSGAYDATLMTVGTGQGTFTYTFESLFTDGTISSPAAIETITAPNGEVVTVYSNVGGEVLIRDIWNGVTGSGRLDWVTAYGYDDSARLVAVAQPSAVTWSSSPGSSDYVDDSTLNNYYAVSTTSGLVNITDYYNAGDTGGSANFVKDVGVEQGDDPSSLAITEAYTYAINTTGGYSATELATTSDYYTSGGTPSVTSYAYTFASGQLGPASITETDQAVSATNNGTGTSSVTSTLLDGFGRIAWTQDASGYISGFSYDDPTNSITQIWEDATGTAVNSATGWTSHSSGLNLKTTFVLDAVGRTTMETDPKYQGLSNNNTFVTYTVYEDAAHEVRTYSGWNLGTAGATGIAPIEVSRQDWANNYDETLTMSATPATNTTNGTPTGAEAIADIQSLNRVQYNLAGQAIESDRYFALGTFTYTTNVTIGSVGTNFYATTYGFDSTGQVDRVTAPTGTMTVSNHDTLGRTTSTQVGTSWANLTITDVEQYDNGGSGDSNLTEQVTYTDYVSGVANASTARAEVYAYDYRDRLVWEKSGALLSTGLGAGIFDLDPTREVNTGTNWYTQQAISRPLSLFTYDNLDDTLEVDTYDGDGVSTGTTPDSSELTGKTTTAYDEDGRAFSTSAYSVDPSTGDVGNALTTSEWYDPRGLVFKATAPNGVGVMYVYDGVGRKTDEYDVLPSDVTGTAGLAGSTVLQQTDLTYDANSNVILTVTKQRFDDQTGSQVGALGNPASTGTTPKARVSYVEDFYDNLDRLSAEANLGALGTNVATATTVIPTGSSTVLLTTYAYNAAGELQDVVNPNGIDTHTVYDLAGRTTDTYQNYNATGTASGTVNVHTGYTYDGDDNVTEQIAYNPGGVNQTTAFVYGVGSGSGSGIFSNDLISTIKYPDPTTGVTSTYSSQQETYVYNVAGEKIQFNDRNGTTHQYAYDSLGRPTADRATTTGSGVAGAGSGAAQAVTYTYSKAGQIATVNTFSNTILNNLTSDTDLLTRVQMTYDGFGNLIEEDEPNGSVYYSFTDGTDNTSRETEMTYDYEDLTLQYGASGSIDDQLSRVSEVDGAALSGDGSVALESYSYLGLDTLVAKTRSEYPEYDSGLSYISNGAVGDAGDKYVGLDRFGRVANQDWTANGSALDELTYTYDRDSNVIGMQNVLSSANSQYYAYDGLDRLTSFWRGGTATFSGNTVAVTGTTSASESWNLDAQDNWGTFTFGGTAVARGSNAQNQITSIGGSSLTYDNDGNETEDQHGDTMVYDAWGYLVSWQAPSADAITYSYDGLGQKVSTTNDAGTTTYLYSPSGQTLMEAPGNLPTSFATDYIYSAESGANGAELICADTIVPVDHTYTFGGHTIVFAEATLVDRTYVQQDANFDVTSTVNIEIFPPTDTLTVTTERYEEDAYGANLTVLNADFTTKSSGSGWNWHVFFQGMFQDTISGLYDDAARWYDPVQGRFISQDPSGWPDGPNAYSTDMGNPNSYTDPTGLAADWTTAVPIVGQFASDDLVYIIGRDDQGPGDWGDGLAHPGDNLGTVEQNEFGLIVGAVYQISNSEVGTYVGVAGQVSTRITEAHKWFELATDINSEVTAYPIYSINDVTTATDIRGIQNAAEQSLMDELGGVDELLNNINAATPERAAMYEGEWILGEGVEIGTIGETGLNGGLMEAIDLGVTEGLSASEAQIAAIQAAEALSEAGEVGEVLLDAAEIIIIIE